MTVPKPDISSRPFRCVVERAMTSAPHDIYVAWTEQFERWFAAPGTVLMRAQVDAPFFFETLYAGTRQPHYGRFLRLEPDRLVEVTWVTGPDGTEGAETVVTVEIAASGSGSSVRLTHAGFLNEAAMRRHERAWAEVLAQQDKALSGAR